MAVIASGSWGMRMRQRLVPVWVVCRVPGATGSPLGVLMMRVVLVRDRVSGESRYPFTLPAVSPSTM